MLRTLCSTVLLTLLCLGKSAPAFAASTIVSARYSSDPQGRVFNGKLYLYTSSDLNQSGNWPMNKTYCYSLSNTTADPGLAASWTDNGAVLSESQYAWSSMSNHLWAPDAFVAQDGTFHLYVPDTYGTGENSRIGVSASTSAIGPFSPPSGLTTSTNYVPGGPTYMSDPNVFLDPNDANGQRYLVYADGDYNSATHGCGHISIAKLDPSTSTITGNQQVQWTNQSSIPNAGGCTPAYMEGPELGYFGGAGLDGNGKYFLYFAIKDNTGYTESIAYGTSNSVLGPYTYQGMVMSGQGGSGWTNQASIAVWQGHYLFFYHNDVRNLANPNRQVFLECLGIQNGKINAVARGSYTTLSACPTASTGTAGGGGTSSGGGGGTGGSAGTTSGGGAMTVGGSDGGGGSGGALGTAGGAVGGFAGESNGGFSAGGVSAGGASGAPASGSAGTLMSAGGAAVTSPGGSPSLGGSESLGTTSPSTGSSSGCSCRFQTLPLPQRSPAVLGVVGLTLLAVRRRRWARRDATRGVGARVRRRAWGS